MSEWLVDKMQGQIDGLYKDVDDLNEQLEDMRKRKDAAYLERNQLVALLSKVFPSVRSKTAIEGWSDDWHQVVYISLPNGQASWHFHDSQQYLFKHLPFIKDYSWDGHTTEEKYERVDGLSRQNITEWLR